MQNRIFITSIIITLITGILIGRYAFVKTKFVVTDRITYTPVYTKVIEPVFDKPHFDQLNECYMSPITFSDKINGSFLDVTAKDACKESRISYKIQTRGNWNIYFTIGAAGLVAGAVGVVYLYHKYK
jgi:hypothetical protein